MTIPQEAIEAAAKVHYEHVWSGSDWNSAQHKEIYRRRAQAYLEAALPAIEKEIRAQVAAELRGELPVQLADTAGSDTGWLSDMQELNPREDQEFIDFADDNGYPLGSIDLHHIAEHAARIAEGLRS